MLPGLHQLENVVGTPWSLLLYSIPLSGCTQQEQGTPCLAKSTGRDIHTQALAQQRVCGHCKGHVQDTTCTRCSPSLQSTRHRQETGHPPQSGCFSRVRLTKSFMFKKKWIQKRGTHREVAKYIFIGGRKGRKKPSNDDSCFSPQYAQLAII